MADMEDRAAGGAESGEKPRRRGGCGLGADERMATARKIILLDVHDEKAAGHSAALKQPALSPASAIERALSSSCDANREPLQTVDEIRPDPLGTPRQLDGGNPVNELLEKEAQLELCQVSAEAKVWAAPAERQVVGRVPPDVELVWIQVLVGVAVGGSEPDDDLFTSDDLSSANCRVACRGSTEEPNR
jgi:hypothetical protein